ncbi:hypothetical protein POM88_036964 [Heracleum sosnowskyi]|uniref:HD-Zip IV C-terminal domain-containing protein n=1 Tax=Heracleum sosnowskyi TaxID=360622 RepID=A0AAD8HR80_9APIA|nr:hypothetical protein POM88_036964 [Heracleum sosnowskyi]
MLITNQHTFIFHVLPLIPYTGREWEVLSSENVIEQVCHISRGQEARNCVSIHKGIYVGLVDNSSQEDILLLQESCSDPVASYIDYSRLEIVEAINVRLSSGSNSEHPRILPSGFVVLTDRPASGIEGSSGSLLTISFQLLVDGSPAIGSGSSGSQAKRTYYYYYKREL